jgi:hypothetical protein
VAVQQCALRGRRERRGTAGRFGPQQALVEHVGDLVRIGARPGEPVAGRVELGGREQQVLGVEVGVAALDRQLRGRRDELPRARAHQPGQVDPAHRPAGAGPEEAGEELVERAGVARPEEAGHTHTSPLHDPVGAIRWAFPRRRTRNDCSRQTSGSGSAWAVR